WELLARPAVAVSGEQKWFRTQLSGFDMQMNDVRRVGHEPQPRLRVVFARGNRAQLRAGNVALSVGNQRDLMTQFDQRLAEPVNHALRAAIKFRRDRNYPRFVKCDVHL